MSVSSLGSTGLAVTPIGLGLAALGRPAYINLRREDDLGRDRDVATMERRCHRMLDVAYGAGIRYVDVARSYGRAEAFLASWLERRGLLPGTITVGSKWGYRYTGNWDLSAATQEVKDHSLQMFQRQRQETDALLGAHLSLYQIHSATLESGVLENRSVLEALADLRRSGVTVGLSVSGPCQGDVVRKALEVEVDGSNPFETVQATWNLLEPSVGPALSEAHHLGWGVLVKEVLANGRLTSREGQSLPPVVREIADLHGASIEQIAMAVALGQPWADVVLSGAVTEAQLQASWTAHQLELSDEEQHRLSRLAHSPDEYWRQRSELPWD